MSASPADLSFLQRLEANGQHDLPARADSGGEFSGGAVWPVGAVLGGIALGLVSAIDSYLQISFNLVIGFEGLLLIVALGIRRGLGRLERRVAADDLPVREAPPDQQPAELDPAQLSASGSPPPSVPAAQGEGAPR